MRKITAIMLCLALVFSCGVTALAAEGTDGAQAVPIAAPVLSDVVGTAYEEAVTALIAGDVVSGYPDGTFLPEKTVSRAEATKMIVLATGGLSETTDAAGFTDMSGHWAEAYANTAVSKGIINGYPDGSFKPDATVTYNEMAKMAVATLGYQVADLTGTWPDNYMNKAKELGIMDDITAEGSAAVTRGNGARMTMKVMILEPKDPADPAEPGTDTPVVTPDDLSNYGCAFVAVNGTCSMKNEKEETVNGVEFLLGEKSYTLPAKKAAGSLAIGTIPATLDGTLYALRLNDSEVLDVATAATVKAAPVSWIKLFVELTDNVNIDPVSATSAFAVIAEKTDNSLLRFENAAGVSQYVELADKVVVYKLCKDDGDTYYETATLSAVRKGAEVRIYDVTDDDDDSGNVVIVDDRD